MDSDLIQAAPIAKPKSGEPLANLVSSDSAKTIALRVTNVELNLLQAQQKLDDLLTPEDTSLTLAQTEAELAQAKVDLLAAQDEVSSAEYALNSLLNGRGNAQLISEAKAKLVLAQKRLDAVLVPAVDLGVQA